jgi:hypothetical protein
MREVFLRAKMVNMVVPKAAVMGFMDQAVSTSGTEVSAEIWLISLICFLSWWRLKALEEQGLAIEPRIAADHPN